MGGKNLRGRQDLVTARIKRETQGVLIMAGYPENPILVRELGNHLHTGENDLTRNDM